MSIVNTLPVWRPTRIQPGEPNHFMRLLTVRRSDEERFPTWEHKRNTGAFAKDSMPLRGSRWIQVSAPAQCVTSPDVVTDQARALVVTGSAAAAPSFRAAAAIPFSNGHLSVFTPDKRYATIQCSRASAQSGVPRESAWRARNAWASGEPRLAAMTTRATGAPRPCGPCAPG